jgi:hypothetical protein
MTISGARRADKGCPGPHRHSPRRWSRICILRFRSEVREIRRIALGKRPLLLANKVIMALRRWSVNLCTNQPVTPVGPIEYSPDAVRGVSLRQTLARDKTAADSDTMVVRQNRHGPTSVLTSHPNVRVGHLWRTTPRSQSLLDVESEHRNPT